MSWERFADRFDHHSYDDDQPVRLWLVEASGIDDELLIPEVLWHRMRLVGAAYRLHLLPLLDRSTDPVFLNSTQCDALADEIAFVEVATDDGLLGSATTLVRTFCARARGASKNAIGIEFP